MPNNSAVALSLNTFFGSVLTLVKLHCQVQVDDPDIAAQLLDESTNLSVRQNMSSSNQGSRRSSAGQQHQQQQRYLE